MNSGYLQQLLRNLLLTGESYRLTSVNLFEILINVCMSRINLMKSGNVNCPWPCATFSYPALKFPAAAAASHKHYTTELQQFVETKGKCCLISYSKQPQRKSKAALKNKAITRTTNGKCGAMARKINSQPHNGITSTGCTKD
ncbi:unnamed protein product [Ceratitis capitata]|uniref:(Mediterranean fruit fly) hypothetical protein n=1 Tax=Ceratitis capitata TaxID=7213 RepID=A0A811U548_CERCA|nr:unnamed protein product [Ceratitis capitata]